MNCNLCPRLCGVNRTKMPGVCASPEAMTVARAAAHFGEEPCISGARGSGTIFFCGCGLRCVFCQNAAISRGGAGEKVDITKLRAIMQTLRAQGVHNINLVTASHYTDIVAEALTDFDLGLPVVWNSAGYERSETLRLLEGKVQIYLPDFKFFDPALARRYAAAPDYPEVAKAALFEMFDQAGDIEFDGDGLLTRGLLIRHLLLPGQVEDSLRVIDWVSDNFPPGTVMFSLLAQYTPMPGLEQYPELMRRLTTEEYEKAVEHLYASRITRGYVQELDAAGERYIPAWDLTGVG